MVNVPKKLQLGSLIKRNANWVGWYKRISREYIITHRSKSDMSVTIEIIEISNCVLFNGFLIRLDNYQLLLTFQSVNDFLHNLCDNSTFNYLIVWLDLNAKYVIKHVLFLIYSDAYQLFYMINLSLISNFW